MESFLRIELHNENMKVFSSSMKFAFFDCDFNEKQEGFLTFFLMSFERPFLGRLKDFEWTNVEKSRKTFFLRVFFVFRSFVFLFARCWGERRGRERDWKPNKIISLKKKREKRVLF